jgi:hypothetical protein
MTYQVDIIEDDEAGQTFLAKLREARIDTTQRRNWPTTRQA